MKVVTFEYASYEDFYYFTYEFDDNKSEQEIMEEYKEAVKEVVKKKIERNEKEYDRVLSGVRLDSIVVDVHKVLEEKYNWRPFNVDKKYFADVWGMIFLGKGYEDFHGQEPGTELEKVLSEVAKEFDRPYYTVAQVKKILGVNKILNLEGKELPDDHRLYEEDVFVTDEGKKYEIVCDIIGDLEIIEKKR